MTIYTTMIFLLGFSAGVLMTLNNTLKVGTFVEWAEERISALYKKFKNR